MTSPAQATQRTDEYVQNVELYTELRLEFDKLDNYVSRSLTKSEPLSRPLVHLRRKIRLARAYQTLGDQDQSGTGASFRRLAAHSYRYFELITALEKAKFITRVQAEKLAVRAARLLELSDPEVAKLFGVQD